MPRRRRSAQSSAAGVQEAVASEKCLLNLASLFPACRIAAGLGRVWALDGRLLVPTVDVAGEACECPITLGPIATPVMLGDGHVYEEAAILQWLQQNEASPCTNLPLEHKIALKLAPLKETIEQFLAQSPAPKACALDRMRRAMREAAASTAHVGTALERLEADLAEFVVHVSEAQAVFDAAAALAAEMRARVDAQREICATRVQAAFRGFRARRSAPLLRHQAEVAAGSRAQPHGASQRETEHTGTAGWVHLLGPLPRDWQHTEARGVVDNATITRKVRAVLNGLSHATFTSKMWQLMRCGISTQQHLEILAREIVDKAAKPQRTWVGMYTNLCAILQDWAARNTNGCFKRALLTVCLASLGRRSKRPQEPGLSTGERPVAAEPEHKRGRVGAARFWGELLVQGMLASDVIFEVTAGLLERPVEPEALEALAAFLSVVGPIFDGPDWEHRNSLDQVFAEVEGLTRDRAQLPSRIHGSLLGVLDWRKTGWQAGSSPDRRVF